MATVSATWTFPSYTRALSVTTTHVPAGARIVLTCKGRKHSCAFKAKTIKVRHASARVPLVKYFKHHKLATGTKIDVRITKPATIGYEITYTTRNGNASKQNAKALKP